MNEKKKKPKETKNEKNRKREELGKLTLFHSGISLTEFKLQITRSSKVLMFVFVSLL